VDYRATIAAIRAQREREIERLRADAQRRIAAARIARDREIFQLRSRGLSHKAIALRVGYSAPQVYEVLSGAREEKNARRSKHWRTRYFPEHRDEINARRAQRQAANGNGITPVSSAQREPSNGNGSSPDARARRPVVGAAASTGRDLISGLSGPS